MCLRVILDREDDGRWFAEIPELPGVLVYGQTEDDAITKVKALCLRVLADRLEHGEVVPDVDELVIAIDFSVTSIFCQLDQDREEAFCSWGNCAKSSPKCGS